MTRDKYIDLCCRASVKIGRHLKASDVNWQDSDLVLYKGIKYYPVKYSLAFDDDGNAIHIVVLHDLKANSTTETLLDKVEEANGGM